MIESFEKTIKLFLKLASKHLLNGLPPVIMFQSYNNKSKKKNSHINTEIKLIYNRDVWTSPYGSDLRRKGVCVTGYVCEMRYLYDMMITMCLTIYVICIEFDVLPRLYLVCFVVCLFMFYLFVRIWFVVLAGRQGDSPYWFKDMYYI